MAEWTIGTVVEKVQWTAELFSLRFEAEVDEFRAGQFTRVGLDLDGERVARPYSYVNAPDEPLLEIHFNIVPAGTLSNPLASLEPGDTLWVQRQAGGLLTLDDLPPAQDLWLLATGTAVGPFLSILKTDAPWRRFAKVVLVQAARNEADLAYRSTIDDLRREHADQLRYLPFTSREQLPGALHGRIPAAITDGRLEAEAGMALSADASHVMLCGNAGMLTDTLAVLEQRGMRRHRRREPGHVSMEKYH